MFINVLSLKPVTMKTNTQDISTSIIEKWILGMVLVLVLFQVIADIFPDVTGAASDLNDSGFPLASFFTSDGVLWYLVAAALLFLVYRYFSQQKK